MSEGFGRTRKVGKERGVVVAASLGSPGERHQDRLCGRARLGPVAAATGPAVDHGVVQFGLRRPVRSLQARLEVDAEEVLSKGKEVLGQAPVGRIAVDADQEPSYFQIQLLRLGLQPGESQLAGIPGGSDSKGPFQDRLHSPRKTDCRPFGCLQHLLAPSNQMAQTRLSRGLLELPVRLPSIRPDGPWVVFAQKRGGLGKASSLLDRIDRRRLSVRGDVEPCVVTVDPPAGPVGVAHRGGAKLIFDQLIARPPQASQPEQRAREPRPAHRHPEYPPQYRGGLSVRQPAYLVQVCRRTDQSRPENDLPDRQSVRPLPSVAPPDVLPTHRAMSEVNLEASRHGLHPRQVCLVLLGLPIHPNRSIAVRTEQRTLHQDMLVHLGWHRPRRLSPVRFPGFPTRRFRIRLGRALGERGRLPLPAPAKLLDQTFQLRYPAILLRQRSLLSLAQLHQPPVRRIPWRRRHVSLNHTSQVPSLPPVANRGKEIPDELGGRNKSANMERSYED
jgi:hypothetical protein